MKVKCIGGPNDGEWIVLSDNHKLHDQIRIAAKVEFKVLDYLPSIDQIPNIVNQSYNYYILKYLKYKDGLTFWYCIPVGANEWECLVKQLEK